ncbi:porin [soil metagenome]
MQKYYLTFFILLFTSLYSYSQDSLKAILRSELKDSVEALPEATVSPLTVSGYLDTYYSRNNDLDHTLDRFPGVSPFKDEFRLNIAQVSFKYFKNNIRGNITIQYGDEPDLFWTEDKKFIQEANVGFSPAEDLWIDAGYFITHIGTESIRPIENTFSTFAMVSLFEPFPQSGVALTYSKNHFTGALFLVNGYNQIDDNNKNKSFGFSLSLKPYKNVELIFNNLTGNEIPYPEPSKVRLYNNLIFKGKFGNSWNVIINNDVCLQERSKLSDTTSVGILAGGFFSIQYRINPKFAAAFREEYFMDVDGLLSGVYTNSLGEKTGLQTLGASIAFEYNPRENAYVRLESRFLKTLKNLQIFSDGRDYRFEGSITMGIGF